MIVKIILPGLRYLTNNTRIKHCSCFKSRICSSNLSEWFKIIPILHWRSSKKIPICRPIPRPTWHALARQGGPGSQTLTGSSPQFLAPGCLIWWPVGSIGGNQFLRYQWVQTCWFLPGWINNLWESELIRTNIGLLTMTSKNPSFNLETEQHKQEEGDNWWTTSQNFFAGVHGIGKPEVLQKSNSCTSFQVLGENNLDLGGIHPPAANIINMESHCRPGDFGSKFPCKTIKTHHTARNHQPAQTQTHASPIRANASRNGAEKLYEMIKH